MKTDIASRLDVHNGDFIPGITAASNNRDFTVGIDPDGTMDVVLRLFRNDDIRGRKMLYDARIDIRGVDTLGVSDAEVQESTAENARKMRFWVRLNQYVGHEITVGYATEDGTALAGSDYQAVSGTLRFTTPDSRNQEIDVPIIADEVNEGDETSKLKPSNATGATIIDAEGIGTIKNDGSLPMGLVSRFGRATASHIVEQVERRINESAATNGIRHPAQRLGRQARLPRRGMPLGGTRGSGRAELGMENSTAMSPRRSYGDRAGFDDGPLDGASLAMNQPRR